MCHAKAHAEYIPEPFESFHEVLIRNKLKHKHFCIRLLQWNGKDHLLTNRCLLCYCEINEEDGKAAMDFTEPQGFACLQHQIILTEGLLLS